MIARWDTDLHDKEGTAKNNPTMIGAFSGVEDDLDTMLDDEDMTTSPMMMLAAVHEKEKNLNHVQREVLVNQVRNSTITSGGHFQVTLLA
eukprot:14349864-Ditylum_brightwellii.AAC.1